jgi:hypothetical protein
MLAVIMTCFMPAARAASRIRVAPETAPCKKFFFRFRRSENMDLDLAMDTTHVEDALRMNWGEGMQHA